MSKYITLEYLTQNNPNPNGIQFKGIFGNRSIGKTHGLLKHLHKEWEREVLNGDEDWAIMLMRRNKLELNFKPFTQKYGGAFDRVWEIDGNEIMQREEDDTYNTFAYYNALSLAERSKHNNYENPYVKHLVVDETFAENPNKNEYQQLETWITTLSRRTGMPFSPITVWLLGNHEYGYSPILEALGIFSFTGKKQKTENGVFLFSDMESPANVLNVKSPLIKHIEIKSDNPPILTWSFQKQAFGIYDCGTHLYMKNIEKATVPYDFRIKEQIYRLILRKSGLPPIYIANYDCLRFIDIPKSRLE